MLPPADSYPRLLGDIGGTHARFALIEGPGEPLSRLSTHDCKDFGGLAELLRHRLQAEPVPAPVVAALGVATPVTGDMVRMTNLDWSFSVAALGDEVGLRRVIVLNDFETLACALPGLADDELHEVGGGSAAPDAARAVLGPGTGLGVAGLVRCGESWRPVVGEGGHVSLAAESDLEDQVLNLLRARFGRVSAERVLSGPGLVNLYAALSELAKCEIEALTPAEVTRRAIDDSDPRCRLAVMTFLGWLGAVAGDLALTLGARGGVYVGGGIAPQLLGLLPGSTFRNRFEAKGRFGTYLSAIPTWVITDAADAALRGASAALDA